jgi:hypothetical protein
MTHQIDIDVIAKRQHAFDTFLDDRNYHFLETIKALGRGALSRIVFGQGGDGIQNLQRFLASVGIRIGRFSFIG